jgi:hypothetical protein
MGAPDKEDSDGSQSPRGRPSPDEVGPFAQLITDTLTRLGLSDRRAARLITDAAWDLDKKRTTVHASAVSRWKAGTVAQPDMQHWIAHGLTIPHGQVHAAAEAQRKRRRWLRVQENISTDSLLRVGDLDAANFAGNCSGGWVAMAE